MEVVRMFCDECCQMVDAVIQPVRETVPMRGLDVDVVQEWPVCPVCGNRIANGAVLERNDQRLYEAYRQLCSIPSGDEIRASRETLGMSQRQLAELLGIGVASLQRYERGALPTEAHAAMMKRLCDPVFLRERLSDVASGNRADHRAMSERIEAAATPAQESESISRVVLMMMPQVPSGYTGGRAFDEGRFKELLVFLARRVDGLFRTKLNKVLFYLDFSMFRDYGVGVTGLRYAHADFGPVPDKFEQLIAAFVDGSDLSFEEQENGGQVLRASRDADMSAFSAGEVEQAKRVAEFANGFRTATALTQASHSEDAWRDTASGELIPYAKAATLRRM